MSLKRFLALVSAGLSLGSLVSAQTFSVADLLARAESAYAVKEAEAEAAAMARKADAVGGQPDTGLGYELMGVPDPEMMSHKVSLTQELTLWGKPELRRGVAEAEAAGAGIMVSDRKLEIRSALLKRLAEFHFAGLVRRSREGEKQTLVRFVEAAKAKYLVGTLTLSSLDRAEIELAQTESLIVGLDSRAEIALNDVFDLVDVEDGGASLGAFVPVPAVGLDEIIALKTEPLFAKALGHLPSYAAAAKEVEKAKGEAALAKAEFLPDLMLEFSYSYQASLSSPGSFSAGLSLNLPIFSALSKDAEVAMAEKRVEQGEARRAGIGDALRRTIRRLLAEAVGYARRVVLYDTRLGPLRAADLENLLAAYAVDRADFEMVLEAIRMKYDAEIENLENRLSLTLGLLELEYLSGEGFVNFEDGRIE